VLGQRHTAPELAQGLQNSCNPVFVELALSLALSAFIILWRLRARHGERRDIPGEGTGILIDKSRVKRVDIARIGFGQSVAVTPLQLLTAACAAVNGGNLISLTSSKRSGTRWKCD
jgi:stage V sporulation protein D (sporulation-specific penicillin-binding protein)